MIAAWVAPLLGLVAGVGGAGRASGWPGALEVDGLALRTLPEQERPAAVERLVARHGVSAAAPFLRPLLADPEPEVRLYIGRLLARAGDQAATDAALVWLTAPGRPSADRIFGLDLLSYAAPLTSAARRAIEQAIRERDPVIRARALEALERHDPLPSLSVLLGALDDDSRDVRQQAILLVAAAARASPADAQRATLPLLDRLEDSDRLIRLAALRALASLQDPRALPALLRVAAEQTVDLRAAALDALGAPAMTGAVPALIALVRRRPADELARHADLALGEIATPAAIGALVAALRAPPVAEEVRLGLLHAGTAAVEALATEVARGAPSSGAIAAELLGEIGDRRATGVLATALGDPEKSTLALPASEALARLGDPAAVPALARATTSPAPDLRLAAFAALRELADPRGVAVVPAGLGDPDPRVRAAAAELAGAMDASARSPATLLAERLADADAAVRTAAGRALARLGGTPVSALLSALLGRGAIPRDELEQEAIGDALEANARAADAGRLAQAFLAADEGLRGPLTRGLVAAHATTPLADAAVEERAIAVLSTGTPEALAAADLLAAARLSDHLTATLARAFADAEPSVRARLCGAIAHAPRGAGWLAALIAASEQPLEVRAAAAWAARELPEARAALEAAARLPDGPLGANARAALGRSHAGGGAFALRLRDVDGVPLVGRWVTLAGGGVAVAAMTDARGVARVEGLAGPVEWRADGLRFTLRAGP